MRSCHTDIVCNTLKKAPDNLSVDVGKYCHQDIVSVQPWPKGESLKEFCEFYDVEFHEIQQNVTG